MSGVTLVDPEDHDDLDLGAIVRDAFATGASGIVWSDAAWNRRFEKQRAKRLQDGAYDTDQEREQPDDEAAA